MILLFVITYILNISFAHFFTYPPQFFLLFVIIASYKYNKHIGTSLLILFTGYLTDIFIYSSYPVYTFFYFSIFLIINKKLKDIIVFNLLNLTISLVTTIFIEYIYLLVLVYIFSIGIKLSILSFFAELGILIFSSALYIFIFKNRSKR